MPYFYFLKFTYTTYSRWAAFEYYTGCMYIFIQYCDFFRAPRWYIGPTAMPRAAVTPIAPERSECAIGCGSRPRHCRRDDIPAWRPNKITLLSLLPLVLTMYRRFISFLCAVHSREGRWLNPDTVCKSRWCRQILSRMRADLRENPIKQWASRDALIQSAGSISNSPRYHSDANIALGPILKMYIPGQIRIFNALDSDGYCTYIVKTNEWKICAGLRVPYI